MKKLSVLIIGIAAATSIIAQSNREEVVEKIDQLLDRELNKTNIHNVFLSIYSPSRGFEWHVAKGKFKNGEAVTIKNPYYTASVGKTFTATAIGRLVDQGKVRFDDPISKYLSDGVMNQLHVLNGVDYGDSITVGHLLQHTSGLSDYFSRETVDGSPSMFDLIMAQPQRVWQPKELVAFSKAHFKPSFVPGTDYSYTDTEYVLLGMIIEEVGGIPLHEFFEDQIFDPLRMNHTYLIQRSTAAQPTPKMAEMYASEFEISTLKSLSADWAGGAIVSTGKELVTFQEALMNGKLVSDKTLIEMQQWTQETQGMEYGYGLRKISFQELSPTLPEWEVVGHSGLNGTSMYYCPNLDIYLAGTLNQLEASKDAVFLMVEVLMQCQKL